VTTISAEIVADTLSAGGARLTTMKLCYPRFIHAEFMTHRALSRNASSSRAIPIAKMIDGVEADMAEPVEWGRNQAGMQARELLDDTDRKAAQALWRGAGRAAVRASRDLAATGVHKQIANRVTEPWQHISVVVTASDWDNFFALRCHEDADPTMAELAWAMAHALHAGRPQPAKPESWCHLPFVTDGEKLTLDEASQIEASVARCARVSYRNHDGSYPVLEKDRELASQLRASGHWSPFEHQGMPLPSQGIRSGNFRGWLQYRQTFSTQCVEAWDYDRALQRWAVAGRRVPGLR
jgi:thymidylate synthase ThyX